MKKLLISSILGLVTVSGLNAADCIMVKELNVQFKNDSTIYANSKEYQEVKEYAKFLKDTGFFALIEGHTSSTATAKYNYDLSTKRAAKVRTTLVSLGVSPSKVKSMGYGESSPLYNNETDDGLAKNRRVRGEVFNTADELSDYILTEKARIEPIKYQEQ